LIVNLSSEFKCKAKAPKQKKVTRPDIDKKIPWGFFYGPYQGHPHKCRESVFLFISDSHFFKIWYVQGGGTNTKVELSTLWALLVHVTSLNLKNIQIFGDSHAIVNWIKGKK